MKLWLAILLWLPLMVTPATSQVDSAQVAAAPACPSHNNRAYHGLWDSERNCHYDHFHGDNPHEVDDLFGPDYYEWAMGEISYPWQTSHENHAKHNTYKWFVRRDLPCLVDAASQGCVKAFRAQVHADMFNVISDFHSFYLEAQLCLRSNPINCGIMRYGGWQFSGDMFIDMPKVIDRADPVGASGIIKQEHHETAFPRLAIWYGISPGIPVRANHRTDDAWGIYHLPITIPVSTLPLSDFDFFCDVNPITGDVSIGCIDNGSKIRPSVISVLVNQHLTILDPDKNNILDMSGYTNRYGAIMQGCEVSCLDCIPISFEHVPLPADGFFRYLSTAIDAREYDFYFDGQPSGWIRFPN